ncbi:uncharacterized protein LOC114074036 [Solanum pennellii]|uniref:Uncharacterized protein LOC114074036 n=1 Tax=Solanum pennellii TaxID=28526 RepID=A0ABM1UW90_SOLPN|nr:uncharacterized protein LOC114074036 [Solanum pennellii]
MMRDRLATAYSRQKFYADNKKRALEFEVGDPLYLRISPMKGVMRFGKRENVDYELKLQEDLASVHPIFHVSMLKKCLGDPASIMPVEGLRAYENHSYEEVPVEIFDRQVKRLRNKEVVIVKVLWRKHLIKVATWEAEDNMISCYLICSVLEVRYTVPKSVFCLRKSMF